MISDEVRDQMRAIAARYPDVKSGMLPCLHLAQQTEGYVTADGIQAVAEVLGVKVDEVASVVSFYSMYFERPVGKYVIKVCTSISCYLGGCDSLMRHFEDRLRITRGETTPDGTFTLLPVECLAACGMAPAIQVNDQFVESVTPAAADELIATLRRGEPIPVAQTRWTIAGNGAGTEESEAGASGQRKRAR